MADQEDTKRRAAGTAASATQAAGAIAAGRATTALLRRLRDFAADQGGAIAVVAAVVFPVVIGGIGMGVETSHWYMTQRKLQHAADIAAHAASVRNRSGDTIEQIRAAALNVAESSGFVPAQGTIEVNVPPLNGPSAGNKDAAEVILTESWSRWFTQMFADGPVTMHARAVSKIRGGADACLLALSGSASGAVTASGSTAVTLDKCDVASNSVASNAFDLGGSATMTTGCVHTVGQATYTAGLTLTRCSHVNINAPEIRDPYRDVAEPVVTGTCYDGKIGHPTSSTTVTPTDDHPSGVKFRRYCNGLDLKGQVTLEPGLYIIEGGDLTINGGSTSSTTSASIIGQGVTFYFVGSAKARINGAVSTDIAGPTSGPFSGITLFGNRSTTGLKHIINGSSGSIVQGAVYAPISAIDFSGNSTVTDGCTQIVGLTVTMIGNSTVRSECENAGTLPMLADEGAAITE